MSGVFYKSVYTTRSVGYKYRTFSVNTDEGCFINVFEEDSKGLQAKKDKYRTFCINTDEDKWRESCKKRSYTDKKFEEIGEVIMLKINNETKKQKAARDCLSEKLNKIDGIIDSLLDFQKNVFIMQNGLTTTRATLIQLSDRVHKVDEVLLMKSSVISQRRSNERGNGSIVTTFSFRQRCPENNKSIPSSCITTHL